MEHNPPGIRRNLHLDPAGAPVVVAIFPFHQVVVAEFAVGTGDHQHQLDAEIGCVGTLYFFRFELRFEFDSVSTHRFKRDRNPELTAGGCVGTVDPDCGPSFFAAFRQKDGESGSFPAAQLLRRCGGILAGMERRTGRRSDGHTPAQFGNVFVPVKCFEIFSLPDFDVIDQKVIGELVVVHPVTTPAADLGAEFQIDGSAGNGDTFPAGDRLTIEVPDNQPGFPKDSGGDESLPVTSGIEPVESHHSMFFHRWSCPPVAGDVVAMRSEAAGLFEDVDFHAAVDRAVAVRAAPAVIRHRPEGWPDAVESRRTQPGFEVAVALGEFVEGGHASRGVLPEIPFIGRIVVEIADFFLRPDVKHSILDNQIAGAVIAEQLRIGDLPAPSGTPGGEIDRIAVELFIESLLPFSRNRRPFAAPFRQRDDAGDCPRLLQLERSVRRDRDCEDILVPERGAAGGFCRTVAFVLLIAAPGGVVGVDDPADPRGTPFEFYFHGRG